MKLFYVFSVYLIMHVAFINSLQVFVKSDTKIRWLHGYIDAAAGTSLKKINHNILTHCVELWLHSEHRLKWSKQDRNVCSQRDKFNWVITGYYTPWMFSVQINKWAIVLKETFLLYTSFYKLRRTLTCRLICHETFRPLYYRWQSNRSGKNVIITISCFIITSIFSAI